MLLELLCSLPILSYILKLVFTTIPRRRVNDTVMYTMPAVAMQANVKHSERMTHFDTDTQWIGVDNRCSGCISHVKSDFVGRLLPTTRTIKGFAGSRTINVSIGTLRWEWEDDTGTTHSFLIPNSYYHINKLMLQSF